MITLTFQGESLEDILAQMRAEMQRVDGLIRHPTPAEKFVEEIKKPIVVTASVVTPETVANAPAVVPAAATPSTAPSTNAAGPTLEQVKEILRLTRKEVTLETPRILLKKHGAGSVNDLKPDDYGAIVAEAQALIDESQRKGKGVPSTDDQLPF